MAKKKESPVLEGTDSRGRKITAEVLEVTPEGLNIMRVTVAGDVLRVTTAISPEEYVGKL